MTAWGLLAEIGMEYAPVPQRTTLGELGRTLSGQPRERGQAQEREDPQRKPVAASLFVPGGLGGLHQKGQLFISFVSATGGAEGQEARDDRRGSQSLGHCLLHPARWKVCYRDLGRGLL